VEYFLSSAFLEQITDIIQQVLHKIFSLGLLSSCQKYKNEEAIICGYGEIDHTHHRRGVEASDAYVS